MLEPDAKEPKMTTSHPDRPRRVVVGVDGSAQSRQALRWAANVAAAAGAQLDAIAAWQYPITTWGFGAIPLVWSPAQDADKSLTEAVDEVFGAHRPVELRLVVQEGNAAKVLLDESRDALMLVVGSRGHGGFAGLLLGSVSANVAEHATCPVLVIHGDTNPPQTSP
jgi:nucleotide-binding universal stress UspA family protein